MRIQGQRIWLIGASSGLGAALVPRLLGQGARLAISARSEDALNEIAARHAGREVLVRPLDVRDIQAVQTVAGDLWRDWDGIDIVIYCPGAWEMADGADFKAESALPQIDVNYLGLVRVSGAVIPQMVERHRGHIVGISSLSGFAGFPRAAAYSSSKAGAIALLQSLRMDLVKHGVGVVTVTPGFFESRLTEKNQFSMPFLMTVEEAADATIAGLEAGKAEVSFPWQLSLGLRLLTRLPRPVFEALARRFMTTGRRSSE